MQKEIYCQNFETNTSFNKRLKFFYQIVSLSTATPKITKTMTTAPHATNDNSKFIYTLANVIVFRSVVIYEL